MPNTGRKIQFKHDFSHELDPSDDSSGKSCCSVDLDGCIVFDFEASEKNYQDTRPAI